MAGRQLTSAVRTGGVTSTTTYTLDPLDQTLSEAPADGSTNKSNFDAAGNATDQCYWKPSITVGSCYEVGHSGWSNPPTQVTSAGYDARNNRISFTDSVTGSTTTYDPDHNYQVKAFYLPTGTGKEHQTLYSYDARHRLAGITEQLCTISTGHSCSSTTATASDSYSYDDNDNRTTVNESNGATSSDQRYCYDALNRLQYRNTGAACSSGAKNESYTYDSAGNRTQTVISGTTTNFAYNSSGQLCKTGSTSCTSPNVTYDTAGRTASYNGWVYLYDAEGRMTSACKSTSCTGSIDKVLFTYDGDGHRTQIQEYTSGTLTTTRDFIYQGDSIVQEKTNGTVSREYIDDEQGRIIKFCDPNCSSPIGDLPRHLERPRRRPWRVEDRSLNRRADARQQLHLHELGRTDDDRRGWLQRPRPALPLRRRPGRPVGQLLEPRALLHARPPLLTRAGQVPAAGSGTGRRE